MITVSATLGSADRGLGTHGRNTITIGHKCDSIKLEVEKTTYIGDSPSIGMISKNEKIYF